MTSSPQAPDAAARAIVEQGLERLCAEGVVDSWRWAGRGETRSVELRIGSTRHRLLPVVRPQLGAGQVGALELLAKSRSPGGPRVVVFSLDVSGEVARLLDRAGLEFVGVDGSVSLRGPGLLVRVLRSTGPRAVAIRSRLSSSDLRLLHVLLRDGGTAGRTHRMIAEDAGIALGAVGRGLQGLETKGIVERVAHHEFDLPALDRAQAEFVEGWVGCLRRKLRPTSYRLSRDSDLRSWSARLAPLRDEVLVGGEWAAERTTGLLRTSSATLHVREGSRSDLVRALELVPDPSGSIHVLDRFGRRDAMAERIPSELHMVHPLLVHAELSRLVDERIVDARAAVWNAWREREDARRAAEGARQEDSRGRS